MQVAAPVLSDLVVEIERARYDFLADLTQYAASARIDAALLNAVNLARRAETLAAENQFSEMRSELRKAIDNLELAYTFMNYGDISDPLVAPEFFVRQHYVDFLDREPDESGFNFWLGQIKNCGTNTACIDSRRVNVSGAFFLSIEFQETGYLVHRAYKASFGRMPSRSAFIADAEMLMRGIIVGQAGWRERLEANKQEFFASWIERDDFLRLYADLRDVALVDALIANTGARISGEEREHLISEWNRTGSRAHVLRLLLSNEEFVQSEKRAAFVLMQYFGYLRRDPDGAGFQFWLGKLNDHGGDHISAQMVRSFLVSGEYKGRFQEQ